MTKSNSSDGRRHNRPPDKNKIGPGEIRNPFGRRGKSGVNHLSRVDEFILKEAERVVSRDESGDVTAAKRLVQEEYLAALKGKDPKARARLLNLLSQLEAKADRVQREFIMWVLECKAKYDELFYFARKRRSEPPDVMHPDHANIVDSHLVITGPVDRQSREQWENLKSLIKIAAWLHATEPSAVQAQLHREKSSRIERH